MTAWAAGQDVPGDLLGTLSETSGWEGRPDLLRTRMAEDGYVLLRGVLPRAAVLAARAEVFGRLAEVGEVAAPAAEGIATGTSLRAALHPDLNRFWRSVCEGKTLRALTHGPALERAAAALFGEPAVAFDFLWLRAMVEGRASPLHFDHVYMNRGSARVVSAWIPLGDVPLAAGPIVLVEGSHRSDDLAAPHRGRDVDRDAGYRGSFEEGPVALARRIGTRLLSADFAAGDAILFGMFTLHGSLDNRVAGRVRLSCDMRWQPAADARDARWFGTPPAGHGGASYGGMSGARPLGAPALAR